MNSDTVPVRFSRGQSRVSVRELTGRDERAVADTGTASVIALLDALLVAEPGSTVPPPPTDELVASDRDRLLVAIYRRSFGDRIENTLTCKRCGNRFDIDFSLDALANSLEHRHPRTPVVPIGENLFETSQGLRFRLPIGREELQFGRLPGDEAQQALRRCCIGEAAAEIDDDALQTLLTEVAPLVDLDLDARCPECQQVHALQFDIQTYLLSALLGERRQLTLEIHRLATAYGWSLAEILSLPRSERRHFVELIDQELSGHHRNPR